MFLHRSDDHILHCQCVFIGDGSLGIREEKCIVHTFYPDAELARIFIDGIDMELTNPWMDGIDDPCNITCRSHLWEYEVQFSRNSLEPRDLREAFIFLSLEYSEGLVVILEIERIWTDIVERCRFGMDLSKTEQYRLSESILP